MSTATTTRVRIPQLVDIDVAIQLYWARIELTSEDIQLLFGNIGKSTITKLKKKGREISARNGRLMLNIQNVNTEDAFEAWGLDISDLELRSKKMHEAMKRAERMSK